MKLRTLFFLPLALFALYAHATITLVQKATAVNSTGTAGGGALTISLTFTGITSGNTIICPVTHEDGSGSNPTVSVADAQGSYTNDISNTRGNQIWTGVYRLTSANSGSHTITATASGGTSTLSYFIMNCAEYSGLAASPVDQTASNSANPSTTPTSGTTASLAQGSELVVTAVSSNNQLTGMTAPPTGGNNSPFIVIYSQATTSTGATGDADYQINTSSTTGVGAAWGTVSSTLWSAVIVTYKAASATCTNTGWNTATGAFSVPTAGSGNFWASGGTNGSVNCTSNSYWQSAGVFGNN